MSEVAKSCEVSKFIFLHVSKFSVIVTSGCCCTDSSVCLSEFIASCSVESASASEASVFAVVWR